MNGKILFKIIKSIFLFSFILFACGEGKIQVTNEITVKKTKSVAEVLPSLSNLKIPAVLTGNQESKASTVSKKGINMLAVSTAKTTSPINGWPIAKALLFSGNAVLGINDRLLKDLKDKAGDITYLVKL
jgi:hypothetical protein